MFVTERSLWIGTASEVTVDSWRVTRITADSIIIQIVFY